MNDEATKPERPYACDENHGSYLDEPTQREVEAVNRYTVGPYGWTICKDGSGDYVTAADHDRIIAEKDAEIAELKRGYSERISAMQSEIDEWKSEHHDISGSCELHANLNKMAAESLGKPAYGDGSSWHDIPEQITALRQRAERAEAELAKAENTAAYWADKYEAEVGKQIDKERK